MNDSEKWESEIKEVSEKYGPREAECFRLGADWLMDKLLKESVEQAFTPRPDALLKQEIDRLMFENRKLKDRLGI